MTGQDKVIIRKLPTGVPGLDEILGGGVALIGELDGVPEALATTDSTIKAVAVGAVRYAGPVSKLLG